MEMEQKIAALEALGFSDDVAEALAERGVSPDTAAILSAEEIMDHYLCWNGICGFTGGIMRAVADAKAAEARRKL